jgi:putative Holliday junction resolvase
MTKVALDVGEARIGLAVSSGSLVLPIESFANNHQGLDQLFDDLRSRSPEVIYVGYPLNLSGKSTQSTSKAVAFAKQLAGLGHQVRMIDERLTTKSAQAKAHAAGKNTKQSRSYIDALAAATILEFALDSEGDGFAGKSLEEIDA